MENYNSLYSDSRPKAFSRPIWLSLLLIVYGFHVFGLLIFGLYQYVPGETNEVVTILIILVSALMCASVIGIWKLKMWGVVVGIIGVLIFQLRQKYVDNQFGFPEILVPLTYFVLYIWLKKRV